MAEGDEQRQAHVVDAGSSSEEPGEAMDGAQTDPAGSRLPTLERILALDVGDRRIGVAISDPLGYTAQPMFTLRRSDRRADLKSIGRVIRKHEITEIVIGDPVHLSGEISPQAQKTHEFADGLRSLFPGVRIHLLDERLTTREAHSLLDHAGRRKQRPAAQERKERKAVIDQIAAVLLLEAFLSRRSPSLLPAPPEE
jgi:putative Holliday junction resolvase